MSPVHERPVGATVEWYTPPELFDALGLTFDLDPAASFGAPWTNLGASATFGEYGYARSTIRQAS